jgi:hypothetical protein
MYQRHSACQTGSANPALCLIANLLRCENEDNLSRPEIGRRPENFHNSENFLELGEMPKIKKHLQRVCVSADLRSPCWT